MTFAHRHTGPSGHGRGRLAAVLFAAAVVLVASPWVAPASCSARASAEPAARPASGPGSASLPTGATVAAGVTGAAGAAGEPGAVHGPPVGGVGGADPLAAATPGVPPDPAALQRALDARAAAAGALDVELRAAVVDRATGQLVASVDGDATVNSESLTKLFTAAYYLVEHGGAPGPALAADLRSLIAQSSNGIQIDLWQSDIIPTVAGRYALPNTATSSAESPETWGSDQVTAHDLARFLFGASRDPVVGPSLLAWMAGTVPVGEDGFDQSFGFNALTGDHGSKQGWSDPGWTPANLHSVGWTDRYFGAVLLTSPHRDLCDDARRVDRDGRCDRRRVSPLP